MSAITEKDAKRAEKEYHAALAELEKLEEEKKKIINEYIHTLEQKKIEELRS